MKEYIYDEEKYGGEGLDELLAIYNEYDNESEGLPQEQQQELEHKLLSIIDRYPKFMLAYQELYSLFQEQERWTELELIVFRAYSITKSLILDENWQFPEELLWAFQENRPLIRFLYFGADMQWSLDCIEEAKFIYLGLLSSNPYDNLGVRFLLLGMLEGMSYEDYNKKFDEDELTQGQQDWFDKKAPKHREFDKFFEVLKKLEEE